VGKGGVRVQEGKRKGRVELTDLIISPRGLEGRGIFDGQKKYSPIWERKKAFTPAGKKRFAHQVGGRGEGRGEKGGTEGLKKFQKLWAKISERAGKKSA